MGWISSQTDVRPYIPRPHCVSVKPGNQTRRREYRQNVAHVHEIVNNLTFQHCLRLTGDQRNMRSGICQIFLASTHHLIVDF